MVDFSSGQVLADSEEAFPLHPFLSRMRSDPSLVRTGGDIDFPLLQHPEVRHAMGHRGQPFGAQIKRELYWNEKEQKLVGAIWFSYRCEGPPGAVHGGAIATAVDSCLGYTVWRGVGLGFVTLNLNVNYRKFVPLGSLVKIECIMTKKDGRKVNITAKVTNGDDPTIVHVEADSLFYQTQMYSPSFETSYQLFGRNSNTTPEQLLAQLRKEKKKQKADNKEPKTKDSSTNGEQKIQAKL